MNVSSHHKQMQISLPFMPTSRIRTNLLADRILSRLRQATETLRHHPLLGRTGTVSGTRELPVHGLLYTIIYRIVSTAQLDIVTILHQRMLYPLMEG